MKTRTLDIIVNEKVIKKDFEVPEFWSDTAARIMAEKYAMDSENSALEVVQRVVDQITKWGIKQGYFEDADGEGNDVTEFSSSLEDILINQRAAFNSPVWFNVGADTGSDQASACFILPMEDDMESILNHYAIEGNIFKGGSGAGVNVSKLRGDGEPLSNGGKSSGPISFMRGWDNSAGTIKSGGKTRRAAKLVCMDIDHPDIEAFIECKTKEEKKAKILIESGIDPIEAYATVDFQNTNHSIRVTNEFMQAVKNNTEWNLINRSDGAVAKTIRARDLLMKAAEMAWETGDPGIQYDDRMNLDNPVPSFGRIESTNPCFAGSTLIATERGDVPIRDLVESALYTGEMTKVYTKDGSLSLPVAYMITGENEVSKVTFSDGNFLIVTNNHDWHIKGVDIKVKTSKLQKGMIVWQYNSGSYAKDDLKEVSIEEVVSLGKELTYNLTEPKFNMIFANDVLIWQCSEFSAVDNSSCNLSSLNLVKYYDVTSNKFDWDLFNKDIEILITSMDILVDAADYPTEEIARVTKETRPLGLGFTNLGALLMLKGISYNSKEGNNLARAITKQMTITAFFRSLDLAKKLGPFSAYTENKKETDSIIQRLTDGVITTKMLESGVRNSQVTLLAPTGTISLLMDCDTFGVEPLFAKEITKTLVGGEKLKIVPKCVKQAKYEDAVVTVMGNDFSWKDHLDMMAACQPHLSGALSKTVNMSSACTAKDIFDAYIYGWENNLKAIAVYRDGSKGMQPLTDSSKESTKEETVKSSVTPNTPQRVKLPDERKSITNKFTIGGHEGYITVGMYEDGSPGELFVRVQKEGSTLSGMMDSFGVAVSLGLQYGIPLEHMVRKFKNVKFEPSGFTTNEDIRFADSMVDYIFRWLELKFLTPKDIVIEEDNSLDFGGPPCTNCGGLTIKQGTCYVCTDCGETSGCS